MLRKCPGVNAKYLPESDFAHRMQLEALAVMASGKRGQRLRPRSETSSPGDPTFASENLTAKISLYTGRLPICCGRPSLGSDVTLPNAC